MPHNDLEYDDYPHREKAVIDIKAVVETPEQPKVKDAYTRPAEIPQDVWDTFTIAQKKAHIATFNAIKIHVERRHGG